MTTPFCKDCFKGVTHEGTPKGKWEKIGGVDCYIGTPSGDYPKDKAVLFLPDVFGLQFVNNQLLVDDFAENGFLTIGPDYLNGDPVAPDAIERKTFDRETWFAKHGKEQTRPPLDKVIAGLKEKGITSLGATGYCFGGDYAFALGIENVVQVTVIAHPGRTVAPALEEYVKSKAPLLINSCEFDPAFPDEACAKADELFGNGKFAPGYKRKYFEGCHHGFAVRGDMSDPKVKAGKEGAFKATVEWFLQYL